MQYRRFSLFVSLLGASLVFIALFVILDSAYTADFDGNTPPQGSDGILVTVVMYDGALGGLPGTQNLVYGTQPLPPSQATQTYTNGVTILDTNAAIGDYAGYGAEPGTVAVMPVIDRTEGFTVAFTIQLDSETHTNTDRAGFSVIAISNDLKAIELAFWTNEIWAQHDNVTGSLFTHAEGVAFDTTTGLIPYELYIVTDTYTLLASGTPVLTGPLRDYTDFEPPIIFPADPYEIPNGIFLGDNTTSGRGRVRIAYVSITTLASPPEVSFSSSAYSVAEDGGTAVITAQLHITPVLPVTVTYTTIPGTATEGDDYNASTGILTFTQPSETRTFTVTINEDMDDEPNETVQLILQDPINAILGQDTAVLTIIDNDDSPTPQPIISFSSSDYTIIENEIATSVTVSLDITPSTNISVSYEYIPGTATPGDDYTTLGGTLFFYPSLTTNHLSPNVVDDTLIEPDETVIIRLFDPQNASLGVYTATLTIIDDDEPASEDIFLYLPLMIR